jgi:hypothetical protein
MTTKAYKASRSIKTDQQTQRLSAIPQSDLRKEKQKGKRKGKRPPRQVSVRVSFEMAHQNKIDQPQNLKKDSSIPSS